MELFFHSLWYKCFCLHVKQLSSSSDSLSRCVWTSCHTPNDMIVSFRAFGWDQDNTIISLEKVLFIYLFILINFLHVLVCLDYIFSSKVLKTQRNSVGENLRLKFSPKSNYINCYVSALLFLWYTSVCRPCIWQHEPFLWTWNFCGHLPQ